MSSSSSSSSRRLSNGRSPLVNQQRQITSFFTPNKKSDSISPWQNSNKSDHTPSISPLQNPNPISNSSKNKKKSVLTIGPSQPASKKLYEGEDVIGKRIRVYWPIDKAWYDASVKSYDSSSGKHLVQYDDSEEELLDLQIEKIEWIEEEEEQVNKSLRRLKRNSEKKVTEGRKSRRLSRTSVVSEKLLVFDDESGGDDDSSDEEWAKKEITVAANDDDEDDSEEIDLDDCSPTPEKTSVESKKRKKCDSKDIGGSGKTIKTSGKERKININGGISVEREAATDRLHSTSIHNNSLTGDLAERFGGREAAKFHFLGV